MKDKLVYVSHSYFPSRNANTIHVFKMCNAFAENGKKVLLIAPVNHRMLSAAFKSTHDFYGVPKSFKVLLLPKLPGKIGFWIFCLMAAILSFSFRPRIVYSRSLPFIDWTTRFGMESVYETHGLDWKGNDSLKMFKNIIAKECLRGVVVISEALKRMYLEQNFDFDRYFVAHDGADMPESQAVNSMKRMDGKLHLGYVGHLYEGRGIDLLLKIAERDENVFMHIVGGQEVDITKWTEVCSKQQIENVKFYGFVEPGKVRELRQTFDVLLAPYQKKVRIAGGGGETSGWMSPLKVFEYMADKKPIIISDIAVLHEVLTNDKNCFFVDPESVDEWLGKIEFIRSNQNDAALIAQNAYDLFMSEYTWNKRAENLLTYIEANG